MIAVVAVVTSKILLWDLLVVDGPRRPSYQEMS